MQTNYNAADLFCGAGGTSSGLLLAAKELGMNIQLAAVNHWDVAIATHSQNHKNVHHFNCDLEQLAPRDAVPAGRLRLLVASPECTHFSRASGGAPKNKQSRASIKYILKWINQLDQVDDILIENVPEFIEFGPLHRKCTCGAGPTIKKKHAKTCKYATPIQARKGEYFLRFVTKLREAGYNVAWRVLTAADYGDPTTRKRLFIIARKGLPATFPEPTHGRVAQDMLGTRQAWKPVADCIDWSVKGKSIFHRKKPLKETTMRRIMAGLEKYGGKPFVLGQQSKAVAKSVNDPCPTIATKGAIAFIEPYIVSMHGTDEGHLRSSGKSIHAPLPAITTRRHFYLAQPYIIEYHDGKNSQRRTRSVNEPIPTIDTSNRFGLVEPFILELTHGGRFHNIDEPLNTITSADAWALVQPFLVKYYGTGRTSSVREPIPTITTKDRFGLVQPIIKANGREYKLDILFRMLTPRELANAMSFPSNYQFSGSREDIVKQIGNAVPVELAKALCKHLLSTRIEAENYVVNSQSTRIQESLVPALAGAA